MIPIKKEDNNIPKYLVGAWAENAFRSNNLAKKYEKGDYRHEDVKKKLKEIYHNKCAYCECSLNTQHGQVEHYRPKNPYYWMALSWSNLLLACEKCNGKKSNKFRIQDATVEYKQESLIETQTKTAEYNKMEKPLLINPEDESEESFRKHFCFNLKTGKIRAKTKRMAYTILTCNLNDNELIKMRKIIANDLENSIMCRIFSKGYHKILESPEELNDIYSSEVVKAVPEREFCAWRKAVCSDYANLVRSVLLDEKNKKAQLINQTPM